MLEKGIALLGMQGIKFDVCHNKGNKGRSWEWVLVYLFMAGNLKYQLRSLARSLSVSVSVTVQIPTDFDNFEIIQITKPKSDSWIRVSINRNYFWAKNKLQVGISKD